MYRVALELPGEPDPEVLAALIEAVTQANTIWYLEQWDAGLDPECCCACAGVLYAPDQLSEESVCVALPHAFEQGTASCHTAAAVAAGHKRASDIRQGCPWTYATQRHRVELHEIGSRQWHAFVRTLGAIEDPTTKMERL